jgi:hypothetical protein
MIIAPERKIVDENGDMNDRTLIWTEEVTDYAKPIIGTGSPEGVVSARIGMQYMDTAGIAGAILYIKLDGDVGGDPSQGWILV